MTVQRTDAVTYAISKGRIDEPSAEKIDAAVGLAVRYSTLSTTTNAHVMQSAVLANREGLEPMEQLVYDRAYGEVMGRGYKEVARFVKASDAPAPAPIAKPKTEAETPKADRASVIVDEPAPQRGPGFFARLFARLFNR